MVCHCGLWCSHLLSHRSKYWECTFQMRYNCHYQECIHTYDPGLHNIQTRHIHLSCPLFHHLLSTIQRTHHFYNIIFVQTKLIRPITTVAPPIAYVRSWYASPPTCTTTIRIATITLERHVRRTIAHFLVTLVRTLIVTITYRRLIYASPIPRAAINRLATITFERKV